MYPDFSNLLTSKSACNFVKDKEFMIIDSVKNSWDSVSIWRHLA
ncbi:hypothetical protein VCR12J2_620663 [Vibrio coralliirubri]|nr:hypothetical protein VCR12J2_620663 [Vibrio coralliirubri]